MQESFFSPSSVNNHSDEPEKTDHKNCDLKTGSSCPKCGQAKLDYNGLLNLAYPKCDFEEGGVYT